MDRNAADVMLTDFPFVDSNATVAEAEEYFGQGGVSVLPVLNPDRTVFGLLTPQNLAHFHRRPLNNPRAFHAWEICDARPLLAAADTPLEDILRDMLASSSNHVLVTNERQEMVGLISAEAVLQAGLLPVLLPESFIPPRADESA